MFLVCGNAKGCVGDSRPATIIVVRYAGAYLPGDQAWRSTKGLLVVFGTPCRESDWSVPMMAVTRHTC